MGSSGTETSVHTEGRGSVQRGDPMEKTRRFSLMTIKSAFCYSRDKKKN